MIERLYDLSFYIYIYFSFHLFLYFIKHPSLFYQHLFHHLKVLMKVHLTLTFIHNKFITFGLCFSVFSYCRIPLHYLLPFCPPEKQIPEYILIPYFTWMTLGWSMNIKTYWSLPIPLKTKGLFLTNCVYKKVTPFSISSFLKPSHYIFPDYVQFHLKISVQNLKFSEVQTFEKARLLGLELWRKKCMSYNTAERLRSEVFRINHDYPWQIYNYIHNAEF